MVGVQDACGPACVLRAGSRFSVAARPSFHRRFAPTSFTAAVFGCRCVTISLHSFYPAQSERLADHATDSVVLPVTEVSRSIITDWSRAVRPTETDLFLGSSEIDWDLGYDAWLQYKPRQQ